jgi:hypothetical protein
MSQDPTTPPAPEPQDAAPGSAAAPADVAAGSAARRPHGWQAAARPPRRGWVRRLLVGIVILALAAVVAAILLPSLVPDETLRRTLEAELAARLRRPVHLASARFTWSGGLEIGGLEVLGREPDDLPAAYVPQDGNGDAPSRSRLGDGNGDAPSRSRLGDGNGDDLPLARVRRAVVRFGPEDAVRTLTGGDVPLESVRVEGLELWLVIGPDGRLNVSDLLAEDAPAAGRKRPRIRSLQITGATVHVDNRRAGRSLTLAPIHATVGEVETTGRAFVSVSAGDAASGVFVLTANLASLDVSAGPPEGSLKAEWTGLPWPDLAAVAELDAALVDVAGRTSGRMSVALQAGGHWSAEGSVSASEIRLPLESADDVAAHAGPRRPPQAILGFQLSQAGPDAPLEVALASLSWPGLDLHAGGSVTVRRAAKDAPAAADATATARGKGAGAAAGAAKPAKTPGLSVAGWQVAAADLRGTGQVTWVPLVQSLPPLERAAAALNRLGGRADFGAHFAVSAQGTTLDLTANLTDTLAQRHGLVSKQPRQALALDAKLALAQDLAWADIAALDLRTEDARISLSGRVPVAPAAASDDPARWLSGAWLRAKCDVARVESLLDLLPAGRQLLGAVDVSGPVRGALRLAPAPAADDAPPVWTMGLELDLSGMALRNPDGGGKPAGQDATLALEAVLDPGARRSDVRRLAASLADARLTWDGEARIDWPRKEGERPVGRFEGRLALADIESAGAVLDPARFSDKRPAPISGAADFHVEADLAEGRLHAHMDAGMERMAVAIGRTFVKPAGKAASLQVAALWEAREQSHRVEASADVGVDGAALSAHVRTNVLVNWLEPDPDAPAESSAARGGLNVSVVPTTTIRLEAKVNDLAQALEVSPLAAESLEGRRVSGAAHGSLVLSMRPKTVQVVGNVDLAAASIDLGDLLRKPAGMPLALALKGAVDPPVPGRPLTVHVSEAALALADSTTTASGTVRLAPTALGAVLAAGPRLATLLEEADVRVHGRWNHTPAVRDALPWLIPFYDRCGMEGPTTLTVTLAGTPTQGRLRVEADATDCRLWTKAKPEVGSRKAEVIAASAEPVADTAAPEVLKAAGTAAILTLDIGYGDVPGEMVISDLTATLADAKVRAGGRLLFDNPRLLPPAAPSAWTLSVTGALPDARLAASLAPGRLTDLDPRGAVHVDLTMAHDAKGTDVEACRLGFDNVRVRWLGRTLLLSGPVAYDAQRLTTDGLRMVMGQTDLTLVAYVANPNERPTGTVIVRGPSLDVREVQEMIRQTSEHMASLAARGQAPPPPASKPGDESLSDRIARRAQRLLAEATLSADVGMDRVLVEVPQWGTTFDLANMAAEARLADRTLVMPRFDATMFEGTVRGEMALDFTGGAPVLTLGYDARDLKMNDNLKPFINTTFPGMQVYGTVSSSTRFTLRLDGKSYRTGTGETVLTDGLLQGPGAPEYVTRLFPGLKMTQHKFNSMSNVVTHLGDGDVHNRMLFDGSDYDVFIFGVTHPGGYTEYTAGIDLSVSLGSRVISRDLDQGKLPFMHYRGRIVGSQFAEQEVSYVLPHEFAYDVFIRRNLVLQLIRNLGEPEPVITRPLVAPPRPEP